GQGGVAISPVHIAVELGGYVTRHFTLGVLGRFQVYTGANAETVATTPGGAPTTKATGAIAGLLRARYLFLEGRFHPYVHLDVGGGQIRHFLDISSAGSSAQPLVDAYTARTYNAAAPGDRALVQQMAQQVCANPSSCTDSIAL